VRLLLAERAGTLRERAHVGLGRALLGQAEAEPDRARKRRLVERARDAFLSAESLGRPRAREAAELAAQCLRELGLEEEARRLLERHGSGPERPGASFPHGGARPGLDEGRPIE
jgi:hypothetical protein